MKVAVTDYTFDSLDVEKEILQPLGCAIIAGQCRTAEELIPLVQDADFVITQFALVNAQVIAAMRRCRGIVRYGIGVDNVDLEAAAAHRIPVCNVPDYCIDEVADHALGLMLALTRQVVTIANQVRGGSWKMNLPMEQMRALKEMTVGVVGFGRIGRETAKRLLAFKCRVLAFDPVVASAEIERAGCVPVGLDELLRASDLVTLHCPSNAHTRSVMNRETLAKMRPGALLVNVARGTLIQTEALVEALQSGQIGGAALDVTDPEPIPDDSPLLRMANVVITNHVASCSVRAMRALRTSVAKTVAAGVRGDALPNVVNGVR